MPIRVLIVDDSAVIRGLMAKALEQDTSIQIVGSAANGEIALNLVKQNPPDIIVLDIEMPVMDGITALPLLIAASPKSKIIMASTLTERNAAISLQALSLGATDYLAKPTARFGNDVEEFYRQLITKIHGLVGSTALPQHVLKDTLPAAAPVQQKTSAPVVASSRPVSVGGIKALAIASSTGGPQALLKLFEQLQGRLANVPIFITQHMPPTFTAILADHLAKAGDRLTFEAKDGMEVQPGQAYVAAGDYHMVARRNGDGKTRIHVNQEPPENFCRPAADPMLRSLSGIYGNQLLTLVLTGMGQDGLQGAKEVVKQGGHVIAQDEATSVVYGMPKAVVENNLCQAVLPLPDIGQYLIHHIEGR